MDRVCCANCEILRVYYYDFHGCFVEDKDALEYVIRQINSNPKLLTGLTISTCNETVVHYIPSKACANYCLFKTSLKEQCKLMFEMNLVDSGITVGNVQNHLICDSDGMPHIMPSEKLERYKKIGGDEGVMIKDDVITVTDQEAFVKSGKWVHVMLYYLVYDFLSCKQSTRRVW
jgi:hypothetical protein